MLLDSTTATTEPSSFILYNCARISAIFEKFEHCVSQSQYGPLPSPEALNFASLLKNETEKKLCADFLFKFEALIDNLVSVKRQSQINWLQRGSHVLIRDHFKQHV